jgi:hypothetical protein
MAGSGIGGRWAGWSGSGGWGGVMSRFGWVGVRGWGWLSVGVVVGVLGCWAAGARAQGAAGSVVVVPRVSGSVLGVYDRMRAAGLRVSIPGGVWFDSLAPPRVRRVLPAAGRRVRRGSVVRLYLARASGRRAIPRGRLPTYVVPQLVGGAASAAYRWVRGKRLDFRAYLGPLRAGGARGLFANYRVMRQRPAAGARLRLGRGKRPAKGSGGFRLTPLRVWGRQLAPAAPCTPPPGYKVIASSPQAVITSHLDQVEGIPTMGWYGCLRAVGTLRLLVSGTDSEAGYYTRLRQVALAGRFAALSFLFDDKYEDCYSYVDLFDLSTGKPGQLYSVGCEVETAGIDSLSVNSSGFAAWRVTDFPVEPRALYGVSCPSVSLCVAVDDAGNVITSTNPTGGPAAWTVTHVDKNNSIRAVTCPSTSLCVATDDEGNVIASTNPTGGAAAWTVTHVDTGKYESMSAVTCPSTSLCVAADNAGNVIASTNPTGGASAWTVTHVSSDPIIAVTCPSTSLCVASHQYGGNQIMSTNPTGGASAWTVNPDYMSAVTCPSTSLCVATGVAGNVITSTNPAGGASAWSSALIDADPSCVATPSCVVDQLYAYDNDGTRLIDDTPPGGLANVKLSGDLLTWTHDGTPHHVTLH